MKHKLAVLTLVLLSVLSITIPSGFVPRVHAAGTGLVCIATISDVSTRCPTSAPIFNGPVTSPNTLLRVPIMINNTDTFNGFDITVNSTRDSSGHSVLKPFGVDLTGSVMPINSILLAECAGSFSIVGSACNANVTIDNPTSIRAAVIFPSFVSVGTTGLLFTAIFSINGTSAPGGVMINFQNRCDPNQSSFGQLCVTIGNGTRSGAPEAIQTGSFDNSDTTTLPFVTISTTASNLGQSLAGAPTHPLPGVLFTAISQNGFQTSALPQLALAASVNGTGVRPTVALSPIILDLTGLNSQNFTQTGSLSSSVPAGVYVATVTATYQTSDLITFTTDYLSASYALAVTVTDYALSINATSISVTPPSANTVTVRVSPKIGFNNLVKLGLAIPPATSTGGITATLSPVTIAGGSGTSILTVMTSSNTPHGTFTLTVTSNTTLNGFTTSHTVTLTIRTVRPDFSISANPSFVVLPPPGNSTFFPAPTITLTSFNFTGFVQLTTSVAPVGLGVTLGTPSLLLPLNGQNQTDLIPSFFGNPSPGTYHVTVTGAAGSISHSTNVTFVVPSPSPGDFSLSANPTFVTLTSGSASATSIITASSLNSFSGTVQLGASSFSAFGLSFNPAQLTLMSGSSASSTLTITGLNVFPGTYSVTVTGAHSNLNGTGSTSHSVQITVQVLAGPPDFQLFVQAPPNGTSMLAGTDSYFGVQVDSAALSNFNGTIILTARALPVLVNGPTLSLNPAQVTLTTPYPQFGFSTLEISTTTLTQPGNYTIIVQGTSGALIHSVHFQLTIFPPPILTLSPSKGPVGTQVVAHGSGFLFPSNGPFFGPIEIEMTFDDQLVGFFFLQNSSFTFTFNVPESQSEVVHIVHARVLFGLSLDVQAGFLVQSTQTGLAVNLNSGTIYFPGDTATIFAMTVLNGQATTVTSVQIVLTKPDGSTIALTSALVSPGVYKATYTIPTTGSIGTYAIEVRAHQMAATDGSALGGFEVKPTWLQSNGHNLTMATGIAGAVAVLGIVGVAWRRGNFTGRRDEFPIP